MTPASWQFKHSDQLSNEYSTVNDLDKWRERADGGDSRYAMALGLIAIADAIKSGVKEPKIIDIVETSLDDKFDTLIKVMEGMGEAIVAPEEELPEPRKNYMSFLTWFWRKGE